MPPALDLTGSMFGKLTVLQRTDKDSHGAWMWNCRCACGRNVVVRAATLKAGKTSACASCAVSARNTTHGMSNTAMYWRWRGMLARTQDPKHRAYRNYGGRGIVVCQRWQRFEAFFDDTAATYFPGAELDRIDNDGPYDPTNCRWATPKVQQRNKRTNHQVTFRGRTCPIQDWSEILGVKANTLIHRLRRGWSVERALTKDVDSAVLLRIANPELACTCTPEHCYSDQDDRERDECTYFLLNPAAVCPAHAEAEGQDDWHGWPV